MAKSYFSLFLGDDRNYCSQAYHQGSVFAFSKPMESLVCVEPFFHGFGLSRKSLVSAEQDDVSQQPQVRGGEVGIGSKGQGQGLLQVPAVAPSSPLPSEQLGRMQATIWERLSVYRLP